MTIKRQITSFLLTHKIELISYRNQKGENGYRWIYITTQKDGVQAEFDTGYWEASRRIAFDRIEKSIKEQYKL